MREVAYLLVFVGVGGGGSQRKKMEGGLFGSFSFSLKGRKLILMVCFLGSSSFLYFGPQHHVFLIYWLKLELPDLREV